MLITAVHCGIHLTVREISEKLNVCNTTSFVRHLIVVIEITGIYSNTVRFTASREEWNKLSPAKIGSKKLRLLIKSD